MDDLYAQKPQERKNYFEVVADDMRVSVPIIEKDFWVVWTLWRLFSQKNIQSFLTFKGGTSLSKVFNLIQRFSEDIDISIEKSFFGFLGEKSPEAAGSRKKREAALAMLSEQCEDFVQGTLTHQLKDDFSSQLGTAQKWDLKLDENDADGQTLIFNYPTDSPGTGGYILPHVKIELGARSEHWPVSQRQVSSYAKQFLQEKMHEPEIIVKVLDAERTFWEKATILHQYAHIPSGKRFPLRLSRHYYDFFCLLGSEIKSQALARSELLEKVARHKDIYFSSAWANYAAAKKGSLRLMPPEHIRDALQNDYKMMREMFFQQPPQWETILAEIEVFQTAFNIR